MAGDWRSAGGAAPPYPGRAQAACAAQHVLQVSQAACCCCRSRFRCRCCVCCSQLRHAAPCHLRCTCSVHRPMSSRACCACCCACCHQHTAHRACSVERVQPDDVFEVPRTGLLLTGKVKALLPLPASFSMQHLVTASGGSSSSLGSIGASARGPAAAAGADGPQGDSPRSSGSCGSSSARAGGGGGGGTMCLRLGNEEPGADGSRPAVHLLAAPAELPPGEFKCLQEAMVLQVRMQCC